MRDNLTAALALAARGWKLIPLYTPVGDGCDCFKKLDCPSVGKHPRIDDWVKNASDVPERVERWWRTWPAANIGMACGKRSGVVVCDVDPRNGGDESINALVKEHGPLPWGPVDFTGSGGQHYYYRYPDRQITNHHPLPGIDIQSDGQQVVVAPSVHSTGVSYEWYEDAGPDTELPEMPGWMLEMACAAPERPEGGRREPMAEVIPAGKRNAEIASRLGQARRFGASEKELFAFGMAINEERCNPPLDRTEVAQIAASVARYEPSESIVMLETKPHTKKERYLPQPFSARALQGYVIAPVKWAVWEILPEGLALLAGRPKLGKSWLALDLALSIAEGGMVLDFIPVKDGDVLGLFLEDNERRLQGRIQMLVGDDEAWPERLQLETKWPRQGDGGLEAIDSWLGQHPAARLVIIDTLAKFKAAPVAGQKRGDIYAEDYQMGEGLQEMALRHGIAIMVITHYNKGFHEDWINAVTGSTGITGAADTIIGLERPRGSQGQQEAILHITGRDVEEQDFAIQNNGGGHWFYTGKAEDVQLSKEAAEVIDVLKREAKPLNASKVAAELGKARNNVAKIMRRLADKGLIVSLGGGLYMPRSDGDASISISESPESSGPTSGGARTRGPEDCEDSTLQNSFDETVSIEHNTKNEDSAPKNGARTQARTLTRFGESPESPCPRCGEVAWSFRVGSRWLCEICDPVLTVVGRQA